MRQARPGFLEEEVFNENGDAPVLRPPEIAARDIPVRDDEAEQELHPPYELEAQVIADDASTRRTAGGSMLRRTTNAVREAREQSPVVPATTALGSTAENGGVRLQQSPDGDSISTAGLNQPSRAAEPFQTQLDQNDSYVYGLRVGASPEPIDLARLASGEAELVEGLEQDLTGAFPEGAGAGSSGERLPSADTGISQVRAEVHEAVLQLVQTRSLGPDASAIIQVLLDQNEALHDRVGALEKSRSGSVTSVEGTGDTADSSGPGGSALVQSGLIQHVTAGGRLVGLREGDAPGLSPAAGALFGSSSQAIATSAPQVRLLVRAVKDPYLPLKVFKGLGLAKKVSLAVKVSMVSSVPCSNGSAAVVDSLLVAGSAAGPQAGHMGDCQNYGPFLGPYCNMGPNTA